MKIEYKTPQNFKNKSTPNPTRFDMTTLDLACKVLSSSLWLELPILSWA